MVPQGRLVDHWLQKWPGLPVAVASHFSAEAYPSERAAEAGLVASLALDPGALAANCHLASYHQLELFA